MSAVAIAATSDRSIATEHPGSDGPLSRTFLVSGPDRLASPPPIYCGADSIERRERSWSGALAFIAEVYGKGELKIEMPAGTPRLSVMLEEVGGHVEIGRSGHMGIGV